ncbi:MAG: EAL domain-containing protein, partial [Actinomycetes bacterium]
ATGRVKGLEALARWNDRELGSVRPDVFVAAAEQIGLIADLGRQAIEQSLRMASAVDIDRADLTVGVNVSPLQLRCPGFLEELAECLMRYGIPPKRFILEVTEGIFLDPDDVAVQTLHQLAELGVTIAIDDFGSGYSSLGYMSRLPADIIKVDRSLIRQLDDPRTQGVVRAIRDMGDALGLDVVMEGVETPEVAERLRALGGRYGQGWAYSKAVPAAGVPALLARLAASAERHVHQAVVTGSR